MRMIVYKYSRSFELSFIQLKAIRGRVQSLSQNLSQNLRQMGVIVCNASKLILFESQYMVLTSKQKDQLNKDILEYLVKNQYKETAQIFANQISVSLTDVDPEGNRLEIKWKSILTLQKKISGLEEENQSLKKDIQTLPSKKQNGAGNSQQLYILKKPAKYELKGHKSNITSLAFHPQYTQMATSSEDGTIKIWQFETGDFQRTLKGHTNPVNYVTYDQQGRYIASCSSDLTIKLWDLNNDYQCFKTLFGHNHNVSHLAFNPEGDALFSCSRDKTIKLWQISTGYCKRTYTGHENWVRRIVLSQDGQTIVSGSDDQSVIVWNINKQAPVLRFFAHDNVIQALQLIQGENSGKLMNAEFLKHKFSAQARMSALKQLTQKGSEGLSNYYQSFILTGGRDKVIKLFILQTGQHLYTFFGHDNWVRSLSLHSSGKYLYSSSDDKTIRIWDLQSGKEKKKIDAHQHFVASVKYNPKYGVVASGGNDMVVKLWHLQAL